jgi:hypothetical protein
MRRTHVARVVAAAATVVMLSGCAWIRQADVPRTGTGTDPNSITLSYWVSGNGRYVYFNSGATNLVPETEGTEPSESFHGIFRRDNQTEKTILLRRNAILFDPQAVSQDHGRLLIGDGAPNFPARLWDRRAGTVTPFAVNTEETPIAGTLAQAALSADGRFVAFRIYRGPDLATFVRDLQLGTTRLVTTTVRSDDNDFLGFFADVDPLSISRDGSFVSLSTCVRSELTTRTPSCLEWAHEIVNVTTRIVSHALANQARPFASRISDDGRIVAYSDGQHVRIYNRVNGTGQIVSVDENGQPAPGDAPSVSGNGRYVAFASSAPNLVDEDLVPNQSQVYVRDRSLGITTLASTAENLEPLPGFSFEPFISADGRYVAFRNAEPDSTGPTLHWRVYTKSVLIPRIADVSPDGGARGHTIPVTITGSGFTPTVEVTIGRQGHALSLNSLEVTETTIRFGVGVEFGSPLGAYDVTVTIHGTGPGRDGGAAANCVGCFTVTAT